MRDPPDEMEVVTVPLDAMDSLTAVPPHGVFTDRDLTASTIRDRVILVKHGAPQGGHHIFATAAAKRS